MAFVHAAGVSNSERLVPSMIADPLERQKFFEYLCTHYHPWSEKLIGTLSSHQEYIQERMRKLGSNLDYATGLSLVYIGIPPEHLLSDTNRLWHGSSHETTVKSSKRFIFSGIYSIDTFYPNSGKGPVNRSNLPYIQLDDKGWTPVDLFVPLDIFQRMYADFKLTIFSVVDDQSLTKCVSDLKEALRES